MLSGILDFFTGGSDKKISYEDLIVPIIHQHGRQLTHTDCFHWLNQKAVLELKKFERPQIGTIKYIGSDNIGVLCAGIEFEYDIGGMSGRVNGQKLFKCKPSHGLLVPVEYVRLLADFENGTNIFPVGQPSTSLNRAQSVPNLSSKSSSNLSTSLEDYIPEVLTELKVGDNVVWLGGSSPQTGIVRWIGRVGRNSQAPIKVWMEMDEYMGFGMNEMDIGTKFGCAPGRGRLLPVEELITLENFIPGENHKVETSNEILPEFPAATAPCLSVDNSTAVAVGDLIDFTLNDGESKTNGELTLADHYFNRLLQDKEKESEPSNKTQDCVSDQKSQTVPTADLVREFLGPDVIPQQSEENISLPFGAETEKSSPIEETMAETKTTIVENVKDVEMDVNGNVPSTEITPDPVDRKISTVESIETDYLPPFIVPPINISEFFKADGQKGIQGKRNSCYIDVVLFSLFAFTETFDPYFLVKTSHFSKGPDSELTKIAKRILAEHIVNPLRQNYYCPAIGVNFLRDLMIPFSDKLDGAFLDIEEFMLIMFDKVFNLKEFVTYDNGMRDYLHQINLGDHKLPSCITLGKCLEMSMVDYGLKFQEVPSPALIIQCPRNTYGMIQSTIIVPNLSLNLANLMKSDDGKEVGTSTTSTIMNLVAVICINDFHFVTFVKSGKGNLAHWVLFDSNPSEERPKVEIVPNMGEWLESLEHQCLKNPGAVIDKKHTFPPHVQRLLSDIYVCIYCPVQID